MLLGIYSLAQETHTILNPRSHFNELSLARVPGCLISPTLIFWEKLEQAALNSVGKEMMGSRQLTSAFGNCQSRTLA